MSFGIRDADWIDPPESPPYKGKCRDCGNFIECPCGCGWGECDGDRGERFDGSDNSCEDGWYADGYGPEEPDYDPHDFLD